MWQRFTERSRRVVFFAQEEATLRGTSLVDAEHLLLGLLRETDSVAARILDRLGIKARDIRSQVEKRLGPVRQPEKTGDDRQLTPRARRVIDFAYDEARQLNNNYIGTEHLLLGLIREGEEQGAWALGPGANLEQARREIRMLQNQITLERHSGHRAYAPPLCPGDLGVLRPAEGRTDCEIAFDEEAYVKLALIFDARDHHGYRELRDTGRIVRVPDGTAVKILDFDRSGPAAGEGGCRVRVLADEWEGRAGWVAQGNVEITGPDARPFPPLPEDTEV